MEAIERAISAAGGLSKLANRLGVKPQVIHNWRARGVPAERVLDLEAATVDPETGRPQVTRHQLRCDLYPVEAVA
jgi:DNA-binding transcriptional regulator YdaS (Cro superfamily)